MQNRINSIHSSLFTLRCTFQRAHCLWICCAVWTLFSILLQLFRFQFKQKRPIDTSCQLQFSYFNATYEWETPFKMIMNTLNIKALNSKRMTLSLDFVGTVDFFFILFYNFSFSSSYSEKTLSHFLGSSLFVSNLFSFIP